MQLNTNKNASRSLHWQSWPWIVAVFAILIDKINVIATTTHMHTKKNIQNTPTLSYERCCIFVPYAEGSLAYWLQHERHHIRSPHVCNSYKLCPMVLWSIRLSFFFITHEWHLSHVINMQCALLIYCIFFRFLFSVFLLLRLATFCSICSPRSFFFSFHVCYA